MAKSRTPPPFNVRLSSQQKSEIAELVQDYSDLSGVSQNVSHVVRHVLDRGLYETKKEVRKAKMALSSQSYDLQIISKSKESKGKSLKRYFLGSTPTVGVSDGMEYKILFTNRTNEKVQVRLSIDGTDILTGELASSLPEGQMWVVAPYSHLELEAWPETKNGGASFIFTGKDKKTVAANLHGNLIHKGIIAAVVFTESYQPIFTFTPTNLTFTSSPYHNLLRSNGGSGTLNSNDIVCNSLSSSQTTCSAASMSMGTGAGSYTAQRVENTTGFIKPVIRAALSLSCRNWKSVREELETLQSPCEAEFRGFMQGFQLPGFPGASDFTGIDLGSTPRQPSKEKVVFIQFAET